MTTIHLQMQNTSHLDAIVPEDVMELTSDVDPRFETGGDIDLDLEFAGTSQQNEDEEDEYMGEDNNSLTDPAPPKEQDIRTGNDDEMVDDGFVERSIAERSSVRDEDLEDAEYTGAEVDEDVVVETGIESPSDPFSDLLDNEQELDTVDHADLVNHEEEIDAPDSGDREYYEQPNLDEDNPEINLASLPNAQKDFVDIRHDASEPSQEEREEYDNKQKISSTIPRDESGPATQEPSQEEHNHSHAKHGGSRHSQAEVDGAIGGELESATTPSPEQQEQEEIVASSAENFASSSRIDPETQIHDRSIAQGTSPLKSSIYVHPVIVVYQDNEISLFPPNDQEEERDSTYFLQEEQLASDTIKTLLGACRSVLGESINEQDELAIDIGDLGLHVSESTPESSHTTLADLIDIYVHLQNCDGFENPPPLYINLTTKNVFSHRLDFLVNAIAQGKGLSQLQSIEATAAAQLLQVEGVANLEGGVDSYQSDVQQLQGLESFDHLQNEDTKNKQEENLGHNILLSSQNLSENPKSTTQISAADSRPGVVGQNRDRTGTQFDTSEARQMAIAAVGKHSEALQANGTEGSPQLTHHTEPEPHEIDQSTLDDGDFIDYEDDEEPAYGTSSGSSTLREDGLDVTTDDNRVVSKRGEPSGKAEASQGEPKLPENTTEEEVARSNVGETNDVLTEMVEGHAEFVENDPDYPEYFEEQDATSSEEYPEEDFLDDFGENDSSLLGNYADDNQAEEDVQHNDQEASLPADKPREFEPRPDSSNGKSDSVLPYNEEGERDLSNTDQTDHQLNRSIRHSQHVGVNGIADGTKVVNDDRYGADHVPAEPKVEPQILINEMDQPRGDDDEITYEDEEDEDETPHEPLNAEYNTAPSPGFLKRSRSLTGEDDAQGDDLQDAKRVRSG